jgi:hypothetical protein
MPILQPRRQSEVLPKVSITLLEVLTVAFFVGVLSFVLIRTDRFPVGLISRMQLPLALANEMESVGAHSWKAVPIQIPYKGHLTVSAHVERGNPMTMMLTDDKGIRRLEKHQWGSYLGEFYAPLTTNFNHTGRLNEGKYYFVIRDKHFETVSGTSDVSVKAYLVP